MRKIITVAFNEENAAYKKVLEAAKDSIGKDGSFFFSLTESFSELAGDIEECIDDWETVNNDDNIQRTMNNKVRR
jgi:hypothetical protein